MNLRIPEQNKVLLVGRLTRDPDLRFTPQGKPVCRLSLAVNRRYKDSNGEWRDETAFVPVVVWQELAERCARMLKKASPISLEGRLNTRKWITKEGENRSVLEVVAQRIQFLSKEDILPEEESETRISSASAENDSVTEEQTTKSDEDVPF
ncbi:MAG TPA: single-stranded DNA-binding protein [Elusimicrobia bacterium]|jgi:single-strand DNA-binding protein|nr:single-stranded DNA-binding protein [Elusimicrobiota bacterium]